MRILIIGAGNMGMPILKNLTSAKIVSQLTVVDPNDLEEIKHTENGNIVHHKSAQNLNKNDNFDVILIAVKPQIFHEVLPRLENFLKNSLVISIAAGVNLRRISQFAKHENVVRVMPNVGILERASVNLIAFADKVSQQGREQVECIFKVLGNNYILQDEQMLDVITPISGSGPGLVFHIMKLLQHKLEEVGVQSDQSFNIVRDMLIGSAAYSKNYDSFEQMVSNVCSKKGVTEKLIQGADSDIKKAVDDGYRQAIIRQRELSNL